jgi:hypothetical protein
VEKITTLTELSIPGLSESALSELQEALPQLNLPAQSCPVPKRKPAEA